MRAYISIFVVVVLVAPTPKSMISPRISNSGYQTTVRTNTHFWGNNNFPTYEEDMIVNRMIRIFSELNNQPVVVLIHKGLDVGEHYIKKLLNNENVQNDFWLMNVNSSGSTGILAKTSVDVEKFHELLKISKTKDKIGYETKDGIAVFFGVIKAIRELPPNSAILVFANGKIIDEDLGSLASKELLKNNIRLFTVWHGFYPTLFGEDKLLKEVTFLSGGQFLISNYDHSTRKDYIEKNNNWNIESIVAYAENLHGRNAFDIPVDTGVTAIRITVSQNINAAQIRSPNGYLVNLVNTTSVQSFSKGSYAVKADGLHEIQLDTAQKAPSAVVGMWRLQIDADVDADEQGYNFTVFIQNNLVLTSDMATLNKNQDKNYTIHLTLKGAFYSINNITLKDKYGSQIKPIDFKLIPDEQYETSELNTLKDKVINVTLDEIQKPFFIEVNGKDIYGNKFVRMNYVSTSIINRQLQPISVETSMQSQLLVYPNQRSNIYFEVTNNLPQTININFICRDTRSYLYQMSPLRSRVNAYETIQVTVTVITGPSIGEDLITFIANSNVGQFQKYALLKVENTKINDVRRPDLWYSYPEDCSSVLLGKCENGYWRIEVTAQDKDSGLKQVTSNPPRLYFPQGYTTGTKEIVTGYYSGSCCQPNIEITAVDMINNKVSYEANAYYTSKGIGIIVGIILLILLIIIVIIVVSVWKCGKCRRKQKATLDLTTTSYRGPLNSASTKRY